MAEHPIAQIFFQADSAAKEADTPQKTTYDNAKDDLHHGHTDHIQHEIHIENVPYTVHIHVAVIHAVEQHAVQRRDLQLQIIHQAKGKQTQ